VTRDVARLGSLLGLAAIVFGVLWMVGLGSVFLGISGLALLAWSCTLYGFVDRLVREGRLRPDSSDALVPLRLTTRISASAGAVTGVALAVSGFAGWV
jgi:hypothetical protein